MHLPVAFQSEGRVRGGENGGGLSGHADGRVCKAHKLRGAARLQNNIRFAERNGASITTIVGDDVPSQVAEYARISDTTKIVVGRSGMKRRHFWSRTPLTEQIILNVPDLDVYIIPDSAVDFSRQKERSRVADSIRPTLRELIVTLLKSKIDQIIYISCNPSTLGKDLDLLKQKYKISHIQAYDMFPNTPHVETVVLLQKLNS